MGSMMPSLLGARQNIVFSQKSCFFFNDNDFRQLNYVAILFFLLSKKIDIKL